MALHDTLRDPGKQAKRLGDRRAPALLRSQGQPRRTQAAAPLTLELVALRGGEVVGVRHLGSGAKAWLGADRGALLSSPVEPGRPEVSLLGEVSGEGHFLYLPPTSRARAQQADGLGRLFRGPARVRLVEGDRIVVLVGARLQVRARLVPLELLGGRPSSLRPTLPTLVWVGAVAAIYASLVGLCDWFGGAPSAGRPSGEVAGREMGPRFYPPVHVDASFTEPNDAPPSTPPPPVCRRGSSRHCSRRAPSGP